jgi:predicted acylesterase/phospholipase RssA
MLGTSAGAWTAAALATDTTLEQIMECWADNERGRNTRRVIELTEALFGNRHDERVAGVAIRLPACRRVVVPGSRYRIADVVAASSSPPRLAEPHRIDGSRYIDAGITRNTSVDRARPARVLIVVAPLAGRVMGPLGRVQEQITRYEMTRWRRRVGGQILFVRPTRAIAALAGRRVAGLFDRDAAPNVQRAAYDLGTRCAERFRDRHPDTAAALGASA